MREPEGSVAPPCGPRGRNHDTAGLRAARRGRGASAARSAAGGGADRTGLDFTLDKQDCPMLEANWQLARMMFPLMDVPSIDELDGPAP
jgi:hypothetical protein